MQLSLQLRKQYYLLKLGLDYLPILVMPFKVFLFACIYLGIVLVNFFLILSAHNVFLQWYIATYIRNIASYPPCTLPTYCNKCACEDCTCSF